MKRLTTVKNRISTLDTQRVEAVGSIDSWRINKQSSTQRGYSYKWQQARLAFLREHPLCVFCQKDGRVTSADVVDHIIPHRGSMDLFWDKSNWQALCKRCHDRIKQRVEVGVG